MATHFRILAWRIPWIKEPVRLQSMGLKRGKITEQLILSLSLSGIFRGNHHWGHFRGCLLQHHRLSVWCLSSSKLKRFFSFPFCGYVLFHHQQIHYIFFLYHIHFPYSVKLDNHISSIILNVRFSCCSDARSCLTLCSHIHGLQHARLPLPSLSPGACSNLCSLSRWYHPTSSSSVVPFSCLLSFLALGDFPVRLGRNIHLLNLILFVLCSGVFWMAWLHCCWT